MPNPLLTAALQAAAAGEDLGAARAGEVLAAIMRGEASEIEIAGLLMALRAKGETRAEIAGLARTMRAFARPVETGCDGLLDTAGTGGGGPTFNVSTTAALIASGAGCRVAKHGNRSATGTSGSADMLEALGVRIDLTPRAVATCVREIGFGFMFAPDHHEATRHVVPVRKGLAVHTVFNLLGPLTNPAGATRQLLGLADSSYQERVAGALVELGSERALVVSGEDGLDELSTHAPTRVTEVRDGALRQYTVTAEEVGLAAAEPDVLAGGSPDDNARTARVVLSGERGPQRDIAVLNAGAAIYVAGNAATIELGVRAAEAAIDDGAAADVLDRLLVRTRELAGAAGAT
ncbi:MAG: anthranilate phosphoribosyltransferase [Solirubrobacteraceae bacterium]|nr:MAG: anthranilate phosphoribosyltransferase [Solirubrobacterales bacterium]